MTHFCFLTALYERFDPLMFLRQGKTLVQAGYKVTYIVCDGGDDEVKDGINIITPSFQPKTRLDRLLHSKKHLLKKALSVDADVYQISDPELISMAISLKRRGKVVLFNLREYYPDMILDKPYVPLCLRKIISLFSMRMLKYYLPKYDAVFCVTDWILDIIKKKFNVSKAYLLANFPIVDENYKLTYEEYVRRENTLIYEGTIYKTSRQEIVFKALEEIPNIHYLIVGKLDEDYNIKDLPYWQEVEFVDGFEYAELKKYFSQATISNVFRDFCGRDGSLGVIKVFDSMEAALPVLFADVPIYKEITKKYNCGICVNPNDVNSIKEAILYLINNKDIAYQMGQNGRKAVIEEFSWNSQAKCYLNVIENLTKCNKK